MLAELKPQVSTTVNKKKTPLGVFFLGGSGGKFLPFSFESVASNFANKNTQLNKLSVFGGAVVT